MQPKKTILRVTVSLSLAGLLLMLLAASLWANGAYLLIRVTTSGSNRVSLSPSINSDGSKITFISDADFLGQGIPDNQLEIWLYDPARGVTRVTTATGSGLRSSFDPSINSDGSKIAFRSDADFLGQGIPDDQFEIWLYDTATLTVTRVTTSGSERDSFAPSINNDGGKIAFHSDADFLSQGVLTDQFEIWLYDTATLTVTRVTTSGSERGSRDPSINGDGSKIAFRSNADFLGQGIPDGQSEIWLYDTATLTVTRVTTSGSGRSSFAPSINSDGSKISFVSDADFLDQGVLTDQFEIWLYDTATLTVTRVTTSGNNRSSSAPSINSDGSKITFISDADFLSQGVLTDQFEIWLYDTATLTVTRVTTAFSSNRDSVAPDINSDGSKIAFYGDADFLSQGISDNQFEIWVADTVDLALTKQATELTEEENTTITYTVSVNNLGTDNTSGVVISDTLPLSVTFVSSSTSNGSSYSPATGAWVVGNVDTGTSVTLSLVVTGANLKGTTIVNKAVLSASTPVDVGAANNTASVSVTPASAPVLLPIILKEASP